MITEDFIYEIIIDNLDYLIAVDINQTFNNIKEATILTQFILYNELLINEANIFVQYFSDGVATKIGQMIQLLFGVSDVIAGTVTTGTLSSYTAAIVTKTFGSASGIGLLPAFGPLLVIIISYAIYRKLETNQVLSMSRMVRNLNKLSLLLNFKINDSLNTEFNYLLKNRCIQIKEKNLKIECAISGYINFLNKFVLTDLIKHYVKYLKNHNENLTEIRSFSQLLTFKSQSNRSISNLMNNFYSSYINFLNILKVNKSIIGDNFILLNNITKTALNR